MTDQGGQEQRQTTARRGPTRSRGTAWSVALALVVGLAGAWIAVRMAGDASVRTGPFNIRLSAEIGNGETRIELPPLGTLSAHTHSGPAQLTATLTDVNVRGLQEALSDPGFDALVSTVQRDTVSAAERFQVRVLIVALLGAALAALVVFRGRWRPLVVSVVSTLVVVVAIQAVAVTTYHPKAFQEPTFSGSLRMAPRLVGPLRQAGERIDTFRSGLAQIVDGASRAYAVVAEDPLGRSDDIRVLHISDLHLSILGADLARELASGFDVAFVLDTGDIASFGSAVEGGTLSELRFGRPYVFVSGNHDSPAIAARVSRIPGAVVLDGDTTDISGLTVYGLGHPISIADETQPADPQAFAEEAHAAGEQVRRQVLELDSPPDIVAVHDDRMAESVAGLVPLVVSGHFHEQRAYVVDGTLYLRIGTTGGAGKDTFLPREGIPLSAEILHFRPGADGSPARLIAYDVIEQFPSTGRLTVTRHVVEEDFGALTPSPSPSKSPTQTP